MNYYEEKLIEIKTLIEVDKEKALAMINEELKMPYIPEKYETQFIKLADLLKYELNEGAGIKSLGKEEIIEMLFSDDKLKMATAIDALRNQNIRSFINEIEK